MGLLGPLPARSGSATLLVLQQLYLQVAIRGSNVDGARTFCATRALFSVFAWRWLNPTPLTNHLRLGQHRVSNKTKAEREGEDQLRKEEAAEFAATSNVVKSPTNAPYYVCCNISLGVL